MARSFIASLFIVILGVSCADDTCKKMQACCDQSSDVPGIGDACTKLTSNALNPKTCHSVIQTLNYMHEDQKRPIPQPCRLETK